MRKAPNTNFWLPYEHAYMYVYVYMYPHAHVYMHVFKGLMS